MLRLRTPFLMLLLALVTACASTPSAGDTKAAPPALVNAGDEPLGLLSIDLRPRSARVFIDDQELQDFSVAPDGRLRVSLLQGRYELRARLDRRWTRKIDLEVCAGMATELAVHFTPDQARTQVQEPTHCEPTKPHRDPMAQRFQNALPGDLREQDNNPCVHFCGRYTGICVRDCGKGPGPEQRGDCMVACAEEFTRCVEGCE